MPPTASADPELIGRPWHTGPRVAHIHLGAAALTPDVKVVAHGGILSVNLTYHHAMVPAVVLAAGKSSRMGRAKATLPLPDGETFLSRIIRTLGDAAVEDVVVVVGHEPELVLKSLEGSDLTLRVVMNDAYESGQLSSVLAGLRAIDRPGVTAMLLTLVDVPLASTATVRAVLERHRATRAPIVRPVSRGRHGHPVLVDRSLFQLVRSADPSLGMKPLVRSHASAAGDVEVDDEGAFTDIDTPEDYARLMGGQRH
jgi:molybdenum cofactor cytidylyltransferase